MNAVHIQQLGEPKRFWTKPSFILIVSDENDRRSLDALDFDLYALTPTSVDCRRATRRCHALSLTARELVEKALARSSPTRSSAYRPVLRLTGRQMPDLQAKHTILDER
ncbi:hypothetical protein FHS21_004841 [Phyllobacterium trifolii]|uniref:Uncharacterized protein n=1 Tax=Phyllobacterium trifolii TaxID=300193 RepID=A0A839UEX6_9HYPH|nr:hypothetical protein [Phyllobacterium trifolii]MBB3148394.1 hypothetical protein [Phyllobacterium trifolii]